jgi:hypothetical protein
LTGLALVKKKSSKKYTHTQIPQQDGNGNFSDRGDVEGSVIFDRRSIEVLLARNINACCAVLNEV